MAEELGDDVLDIDLDADARRASRGPGDELFVAGLSLAGITREGHLLKNEKTSLSQSMNKVRTLRRIVLTGTPLQNNLKECKYSLAYIH